MGAAAPRRASLLAATAVMAFALAGCDAVDPSPGTAGDCEPPLPEIASPDDLPWAILRVNGEDLAPVRGDIIWTGGSEAVEHEGPERVHLQRFIVTVVGDAGQASVRLSDGLEIAAWEVWVVPTIPFRRGDLESDRTVWSAGGADGARSLLCIDLEKGDWLVAADLAFAGDTGEGTYYWRIIVNR